MVSSTVDEARKPPQIIVSANEVFPNPSNRSTEALDPYETSIPSTPRSAHTMSAFDVDLESMKPAPSHENLRKGPIRSRFTSDNSQWPGQAYWREKALAAKRKNRSCQCLARLSKPAQIAIKIAIVLFILGIAVGVGFGISKSLGARIWQPKDDRR
ncbi:hypothetical protein F5Y03DRAFT_47435 [Xylaria venustula]|nr:hypothetical protein F5Y03DRAFT_47435 [Xylaria venustula]